MFHLKKRIINHFQSGEDEFLVMTESNELGKAYIAKENELKCYGR